MKISEQYPTYAKRTLIVVTNNEIARIFLAEEREVEEQTTLYATNSGKKQKKNEEENSKTEDEQKTNRAKLYKHIIKTLKIEQKNFENLVLCAPEALKNELFETLPEPLQQLSTEVIAKNLASLPLDQIIRILQEKKTNTRP